MSSKPKRCPRAPAPGRFARPPLPFDLARRRLGIPPSRLLLVVRVADQTVSLFARARPVRSFPRRTGPVPDGNPGQFNFVRAFPCSTSRFGIGQAEGSNRTPLGLHRVAEKIGGGWPAGTVFKSRKVAGLAWKAMPSATITSRILWLDGLEPGFNRGGRVDSHGRYIYIHGTGDEPGLGRPASCGCIHLATNHLLPLFDLLPVGTLVWIGEK
jgi:L,D-transpeptidase catalytic domain